MQCPECGAPHTEVDLFCGECGAVLDTFDAQTRAGEVPARETPGREPAAAAILDLDPVPGSLPAAPALTPTAPGDARASVAFVLGIVSLALLVVSWLPCVGVIGCFQPVAAIVAIVLGAIVRRDVDTKGGLVADRKRAQQGMVMGIVALALYAAFALIGLVLGFGLSILGEL